MSDGQPTIEYRDIPGHPGYRVGSDGSVWSAWKSERLGGQRGGWEHKIGDQWKKLKPIVSKRPKFKQVRINLRCKAFLVHRLVLLAFVGPCPEGMEGCHNDGDPTNNALSNLRWDTHKANEADKERHGTHQRGEQNGAAKLTPDGVRFIRDRSHGLTQQQLADRFGVSQGAISKVSRGLTWSSAG